MKKDLYRLFALLGVTFWAPGVAWGTEVTTANDETEANTTTSLREAITSSNSGETITFAPSLSGQTITLLGSQLTIDKSLTIDASLLARGLTIDAAGLSRVMEIEPDAIVNLHGLTLTGGHASGSEPDHHGGAIYNDHATLNLSACILSDNFSDEDGGAIYNDSSFGDSATLTLSECTLSRNSAKFGGGIFSNGIVGSAEVNLSACTLSNNSSQEDGGGIANEGHAGSATLNLSSCTLFGNSAGEGGGIFNTGDSGNAVLNLSDCTVSGNSAESGGGICCAGTTGGSATLSLSNTILAGNTVSDRGPDLREISGATTTASGHYLISGLNDGHDAIIGGTGILGEPQLSPLGHYGGPTMTMHPLADSPAILSGADVTRTDQRGFTLTGPGTIGAVKLGPVTIVDQRFDRSDTPATTLRQALADTATIEAAVIQFDPSLSGRTITLTRGELAIDEANFLFIDGANLGLTINASGQATNHRVLSIDTIDSNEFAPATVTLQGLTLQGGRSSGNGGGLHIDGDFVNLINCTFLDNECELAGGAIYCRGADNSGDASLTLHNCRLERNQAGRLGGAIAVTSDFANSPLFFHDSIFSNNSSGRGGGAIAAYGGEQNYEVTGSHSTFSGNSSRLGGAFYTDYSIATAIIGLTDCTFNENSAQTDGGAFYSRADEARCTFNIEDSTFAKNEATENGGALYSEAEVEPVTFNLLNCTLAENSARSGGAIFAEEDFSGAGEASVFALEHCTISQNTATSAGGGFHAQAKEGSNFLLQLDNTILANNSAPLGPDLREDSDASAMLEVELLGSNILSSVAGSSLSASLPRLIISPNPVFPLGHYGGPTQTMHPLAGSPAILATTATRTDQRGFTLTGPETIGAVKIGPVHPTKVSDEDELRAALLASTNTQGRIICFAQSLDGQTITLSSTQLEVPGTANGLFIDASDLANGLTIDADGSATARRRVMLINEGATAALHGLTLTGGVAPRDANYDADGGGIYNDHARLSLIACTLTGNISLDFDRFRTTRGGGIFSNGEGGSAMLSLSACTLSGNSVERGDGGGIYSSANFSGSATLSLSDCTLSDNSAEDDGGGIYSDGGGGRATLSLSTCTLSDNSAENDGGGIYNTGYRGNATLSLSACTLSDNSAEDNGGGIYNDGESNGSATLSLSDCILSGNSAKFGGGIYSIGDEGRATLNLSACTLSGNSAGSSGGGIWNNGGDGNVILSLSACTLSDNSAENSGGGIYSDGLGNNDFEARGDGSLLLLNMSACTFSGNSAQFGDGGGIFSDGGMLSLSACTISGNEAGRQGGGIDVAYHCSVLSLSNTILAGNTAPTGPDLWKRAYGSATATGNNLMSSVDGQDKITLINGASIKIAEPRLAPLGDYGGPTQTMIPLPGSPALDAAATSTRSNDQRGFAITDGIPDIGAVEFQGDSDFQLALPAALDIDHDGDGSSYGVELALGTDPFVADPEHPNNLSLLSFNASDQPQVSFGIDDDQQSNIILRLMRSTDLITFGDEIISNATSDFALPLIFPTPHHPQEGKPSTASKRK